MAFSDESMVMPVAPAYSGGMGGMGGFGGWDSSAWLILIILFGLGGWGGMGGFGGGFGNMYEFPWLLNGQQGINANTNAGFNNLSTQNQITAVQSDLGDIQTQLCSGFGDVQNSLCNGFAGVNATVNAGFANAESSANARQMANMQQAFNAQTAVTQGISGLSSQFADCCCENRLASCQTQNIIQNEANATRFADANNTRDIIQSQSNGTQAILDKLCQLELDGKNDRIADLERQLTMANLAASQNAQTGRLLADNAAQTTALEQYLNPVPVPAYMVQNPNCCTGGCGNF